MRSALLLVLMWPFPAWAWVCSRVQDNQGAETGPALSWFTRDIPYVLHEAGTADIQGQMELDVLRQGFLPWQQAEGCAGLGRTDLRFTEAPALSRTDAVGYNFLHKDKNENLLVFRDQEWPHAGHWNIIALTTTTHNAITGEIFDSDIEYNSKRMAFTVSDTDVVTDLLNTTVHELGHFLGLAHNTNNQDATMYGNAQDGEVVKRDLHCDDQNAMGFKYPSDEDNGYCDPTPSCGNCAPPERLHRVATITVTSTDDGLGGCATLPTSALSVLLAMLVTRRRYRARAPF